MIAVTPDAWRNTIRQLQECGRGRRECVVYWLSAVGANHVDEVAHPDHMGLPGYYEVDSKWFHRFWVDLDHRGRSVVAQVHTHAGRAFHSVTDDEGAIVQVPGFLSIVLPGFAMLDDCLKDGYIARLGLDGVFKPAELESAIRFIS